MDHNSLQEAYNSIYNEDLQEASAFIGGSIGKGKKEVTVGGSAGGFSARVSAGSRKGKDISAAAKAAATNAVADRQNAERSKAIADRSAAAKSAAAKPAVKKGAKGAAALGGEVSLSDADRSSRKAIPSAAAKVAEPETKSTRYASASLKGSKTIGKTTPKSAPSRTPSTKRPDKPDTPAKPTGGRPTSARPTGARPTSDKPSRPMGGGVPPRRDLRMDETLDVESYNLVLEYLLDGGYASTIESADKIILNMSEGWFQTIVEDVFQ